MTKNEELNLLLEIMRKYDLPVSPILEFAIRNKMDDSSGDDVMIAEVCSMDSDTDLVQLSDIQSVVELPINKSSVNEDKDLSDYADDFASLSVAVSKGKKLPHKAVLLLGFIQLIEDGELESNMIPLDKSVADAFGKTWSRYFNTKAPSVWTPFYHLKGEPFWHFKARESDEMLDILLSFGGTPSVGKMRSVIRYAYFDETLFGLINNVSCREVLKKVLIENYLP